MKQILKRFTTGMAWSLIVLAGTTIAAAPEASAHGNDKVRYVDYDRYVYKRSAREFPRWLRGKRNFQRAFTPPSTGAATPIRVPGNRSFNRIWAAGRISNAA